MINILRDKYGLNRKEINFIIVYIILLIIFIVILPNAIFRLDTIISGSMKNTFQINDTICTNKLVYFFEEPKRGEIISFKLTDDDKDKYTKRIIGVPGDTVTIKEGYVYINNEKIEQDYTIYLNENAGPFRVPEDTYFIMGDNRPDSYDSRYWNEKYIPIENIIGKVIFSYNIKELKFKIH